MTKTIIGKVNQFFASEDLKLKKAAEDNNKDRGRNENVIDKRLVADIDLSRISVDDSPKVEFENILVKGSSNNFSKSPSNNIRVIGRLKGDSDSGAGPKKNNGKSRFNSLKKMQSVRFSNHEDLESENKNGNKGGTETDRNLLTEESAPTVENEPDRIHQILGKIEGDKKKMNSELKKRSELLKEKYLDITKKEDNLKFYVTVADFFKSLVPSFIKKYNKWHLYRTTRDSIANKLDMDSLMQLFIEHEKLKTLLFDQD